MDAIKDQDTKVSAPFQIRFTIKSRLQDVSLAGISISSLCRHFKLDDTTCFQVETCAVEAINNAIIHAYHSEPQHEVNITWMLDEAQLTIDISDRGNGMKKPPPEGLVSPEDESGRGWFILQQWMDQVEYTSRNNINTTRLIKRLG